jgi:MFS family permease
VIAARRLIPELPRAAWAVLAGDALSSIGTGLTLPFLVVYLHRVRGIGLEPAMVALSALALAGFVGNPVAGSLSDRIGPRDTLIAGLMLSAIGAGSLAMVSTAWESVAAAAGVGLGAAVAWPAQDALLASVVEPSERSAAFALRYATMNAALGIGALSAAAIVDTRSSATFVSIYMLDALSFLGFIPILLRLPRSRVVARDDEDARRGGGRGYRAVLGDRTLVRLWLLTALLVAVGYAQMDSALPVFATRRGGITAGGLAIVFAANTLAVVIAQLVVLRLMRGRRRTSGLIVLCGFWACAWALTLVAGGLGGGTAAVAGFAAANVAFALGETLVSPTLPAMVNDLAPDSLRGRYNGAYVLAWTTGFAAGPVIAGLALTRGHSTELFSALIGACALAAVASARLARQLPLAANLQPADDHASGRTPAAIGVSDAALA